MGSNLTLSSKVDGVVSKSCQVDYWLHLHGPTLKCQVICMSDADYVMACVSVWYLWSYLIRYLIAGFSKVVELNFYDKKVLQD